MQSYSDKYTAQHSRKSFESYLIDIRRKHIIKNLKKCDSILEVGCGIDPLFLYFLDFKEFTVVEKSQKLSYNVFDKSLKVKGNINVIKDSIENVHLRSFDFIILSSLLHLVVSPKVVIDKIHLLCHKDTTVLINVPNSNSFHRHLGKQLGIISNVTDKSDMDIKFGHITNFTQSTLQSLFIDKWKILDCHTYCIKPFSDKQMTKVVNKELVKGLEKMIKFIPNMGCEIFLKVKIS